MLILEIARDLPSLTDAYGHDCERSSLADPLTLDCVSKTPAVSRFSVCERLLSHTAFGITDADLHSSAVTCHHLR